MTTSSDLTFITNEPGKSMRDRFAVLLEDSTRTFDCLVGYFFISGFYKLYPFLEKVEKIRILVGIQISRVTFDFIQKSREQDELPLQSHAMVQEQVSKDVLGELERSADSAEVETGIQKFIEWLSSGRKNLGGGMLKAEAIDLEFLPIYMDFNKPQEIENIVCVLAKRKALITIQEIDTDEHKKIDQIVFDYLQISNGGTECVNDLRQLHSEFTL